MSDKKVGRFGGRPITPTAQMERALSDSGQITVADTPHDKGKSAVADKFREREERWRRDQALHDQQAAHPTERAGRPAGQTEGEAETDRTGPGDAADREERGEGGEP